MNDNESQQTELNLHDTPEYECHKAATFSSYLLIVFIIVGILATVTGYGLRKRVTDLVDDQAKFKAAVANNLNVLVTVVNEHSKALEQYNKARTNLPNVEASGK